MKTVFNVYDKTKVLRDPIHQYINISYVIILELIDTKEFQRLRRIHQLGGTSQTYHGAEHSRFQHSLGVYEIVRGLVMDNEFIKDEISEYDKICVMIAALLHDVGHGPFSHAFESVFSMKHELRTIQIIEGDSEINKVLSAFDSNLVKDVASIIAKTHPNEILVNLISSQLDADRMDYLLRDAYYTGTSYGNFDISRLLRTIRIHNNQIVFTANGVQAVVHYVLARYHMYWQVYFHPTSRAYELLIVFLFKRINYLHNNGYKFKVSPELLIPFIEGDYSLEDFNMLDESTLMHYFNVFQKEEDSILSDLATRFINRKLLGYCEFNVDLYNKLKVELGNKSDYYLVDDEYKQMPYSYGDDGINQIKILTENYEIKDLAMISEIVNAIVYNAKDKQVRRLFTLKEMLV